MTSNDRLLSAYLAAQSPRQEQDALEELMRKHLMPRISSLVRGRMRRSLEGLQGSQDDADDITYDALAAILRKLRELKKNPDVEPMEDVLGYAARTAYHAYDAYLRKRYPARSSLTNQIRYALTHAEGLALERVDGVITASFTAWKARPPKANPRAVEEVEQRPTQLAQRIFGSEDPGGLAFPIQVAKVLDWIGGPVPLDTLVRVMAAALGVRELRRQEEDGEAPPVEPASPARTDLDVENRDALRVAWQGIQQLPQRQRTAHLLFMRDHKARGVMALLAECQIADADEIAAAMEMSTERLRELWPDLPMEDTQIGIVLGTTRDQATGLRRAARDFLERFMRRNYSAELPKMEAQAR